MMDVTIKVEVTPEDFEESNNTIPESVAIVDHTTVKKETNSNENEVFIKAEVPLMDIQPNVLIKDEIVDTTYNNHYYLPSDVGVKQDVRQESFLLNDPLCTSREQVTNKTTFKNDTPINVEVPSTQTKPKSNAIKEQIWVKEEIVDYSNNEIKKVNETYNFALNNETQIASSKNVIQNKNTNVGFLPTSERNKVTARNHKLHFCDICNQQFKTLRKLRKHVQDHHKEIPINHHSLLRRHVIIHKGEKPHTCTQCNKTFNQGTAFQRHVRAHTVKKQFICAECNKTFAKDYLLKQHIQRNHKCDTKFTCNHCDARFQNISSLKQHLKIHQSNQSYGNKEQINDSISTDGCFIEVELPPPSEINETLEQNNSQNKPDIVESYACKHCNKKYPYTSSLRRHVLKVHIGLKPYECTQCDKRYSESCQFQQHLKVHTEKDKYKCNICEKTFALNSTYSRHLRIHSGEKRHICVICDKRFFESCSLQRHIRTHTGEKPFTCDQCNKGFVEKSALSQHLRIHTGEKPHECEVCHRRFSQLSVMQRHLRTHTGEKPYKCEWCGKRFIHSGNLSQHIPMHIGHQSHFACTQCDKTYIHRKSYQNHMMKVHP